MSIFDYQAAIKITFDKEILTDPCIITGTEYFKIYNPFLSPHTLLYSSQGVSPVGYAFDNDTGTYWAPTGTPPSMPQWIGQDLGEPISLTRMGFYLETYPPNAYQIQGSSDNSNWNTVASGNFSNSTGWQYVTFSPTTYRYWRVYITSVHSSYLRVYEMVCYGTHNTYNVSAWTVTGNEYKYQPEGTDIAETYTVKKVTKALDNLSITLWLDMFDRMTDLHGDITVSYNKALGNLAGEFDAYVESFSQIFTPTNIVPYSQPHVRDNLTSQGKMTVSVNEVVYKYIPAESNTFLVADKDNPYMDENISAQANMTVVVTKVGDQPL